MQRLFTIVQLFKEYFVVTLLVVISLILLGSNDNKQLHAIRAYTVGFIGMMQSGLSIIPNVVELRHENEVLRQLNVDLSDEVGRLREARLENLKLREMVGLKERAPFKLVPAEVVGKSLHMMRNTITLNVGERESVKPDMPIISSSGLVGKILVTSEHYSVGQLVMNKDFRASAKTQRSRVDGIIAWDGSAMLRLNDVAKTQDVKEGDVITTSEYSNVFPPNIKIGMISRVSEKQGALFKEIEITPSVDFSSLEEVFVIVAAQDSERVTLEHKVVRAR